MPHLTAFLGTPGLADVGLRFYDAAEAPLGGRITAGILDAGEGWYTAELALPVGAVSVRWNSISDTKAKAREYLEQSVQLAAIEAKTALIQSGNVTAVFPVSINGTSVQLTAGDDYQVADGRALEFSSDDWPDLTGGAVIFKLGNALSLAATITAARTVCVELTSVQTAVLTGTQLRHELEATLANGHVITLLRGTTTVVRQL